MPSYKVTISGDDKDKTNQRITLVFTQPLTGGYCIQESHFEHSLLVGNKLINDASRRLFFDNVDSAIAYPKAIGLINWEAEIKDEQGNFVKRLSPSDKDITLSWDRLQALITTWSGLTNCEWA